MKKTLFLSASFLIFFIGTSHAKLYPGELTPEEIAASTTPIGSSFYRHLADDFNIDLKELVKFERKGFSRTEIVTLVLISDSDVKKLKEIGNRRIKDLVPLEKLVKEAGYEYRTINKVVRQMKSEIEERGDKNLPPPVFEKPKEKK